MKDCKSSVCINEESKTRGKLKYTYLLTTEILEIRDLVLYVIKLLISLQKIFGFHHFILQKTGK